MIKACAPVLTVFCLYAVLPFLTSLAFAWDDEDYVPPEENGTDETKNELPEDLVNFLETDALRLGQELEDPLPSLTQPPAQPPLPTHPLFSAIVEGNLDNVRAMIEEAPYLIYLTDPLQQTVLHIATGRGNLPITEFLLNQRAVLEARNQYGQTPLSFAVVGGHADVVRALLRAGANPFGFDNKGYTAIQRAVMRIRSLSQQLEATQGILPNTPAMEQMLERIKKESEAAIEEIRNAMAVLQEAMTLPAQEEEMNNHNPASPLEPLFNLPPLFNFLPEDTEGTENKGVIIGASSFNFPFS